MALWLAALLGLGGLVAGALSLPQLGTAMLMAIALIGALAGAVLGLLIGRKVYRASKVFRANNAAPDEPAQAPQRRRTPINAHAELGEGGLDGPVEELEEGSLALLAEQEWAEAEPETELEAEPETEAEAEAEPAPATATPASELETLPLPQLASRLQDAVAARRAQRGNGPGMQNAPGTSAAAAPTFAETPANPPAIKARPDDAQPDDAEGSDPRASAVHHPAQKPFVEAGELMADHDDEEPLEDETALGETYTSLLAMTASVRTAPEQPGSDNESQSVNFAQDPAQTLAALDRASERRAVATAPLRKLDPQDQSLRDALMNLQQFTRHS